MGKLLAAAVLGLFAVVSTPSFLQAAPAGVEVTARVDRTEITMGDRVLYEILVTHPAEGRIDLPAVRGNVGHFEVQDYRIVPDSAQASPGRVGVRHALTLTSFTLGEDTLPPQRVEYRTPGDTAPLVLYTPPTFIRVKRVTPANVTELADITGPERLPGTVPWGLFALLTLAAAAWGWHAWRKKHPRLEAARPRPPLPPYEDALEKLRALENAGLPAQGLGREFAFALSEILRGYIGGRYEVDALEATTEELLRRAAALPLAPDQHVWLEDFTRENDAVKFATGAISHDEAARQLEAARAFLHGTRPVPEAPQAKAEAP